MKKAILVLAALLVFDTRAFADPPGSWLYAVQITTDSKPISGYINIYDVSKVDVAKPDLLKQMKAAGGYDSVWFWSNLVLVAEPYGMYASWGWPTGPIKLETIKKIVKTKGPLDGKQYSSAVLNVTAHVAGLLQKPAVYKCTAEYVESGEYWLSYDPKVGENELKPFCVSKPSEEQLKAIQKNRNIVHLEFSED